MNHKHSNEYKIMASKRIKNNWVIGVYDNRPLPTPEIIEKRRQAQLAQNRTQSDFQKSQASKSLSKKWLITFPDGHQETIINLKEFCTNNNLDQGNMVSVSKGRCKQHKRFVVSLLQ